MVVWTADSDTRMASTRRRGCPRRQRGRRSQRADADSRSSRDSDSRLGQARADGPYDGPLLTIRVACPSRLSESSLSRQQAWVDGSYECPPQPCQYPPRVVAVQGITVRSISESLIRVAHPSRLSESTVLRSHCTWPSRWTPGRAWSRRPRYVTSSPSSTAVHTHAHTNTHMHTHTDHTLRTRYVTSPSSTTNVRLSQRTAAPIRVAYPSLLSESSLRVVSPSRLSEALHGSQRPPVRLGRRLPGVAPGRLRRCRPVSMEGRRGRGVWASGRQGGATGGATGRGVWASGRQGGATGGARGGASGRPSFTEGHMGA